MRIIQRLKRKMKLVGLRDRGELTEIAKHSFLSTYELRKRSDCSIGKYTYGCPTVRSGGGVYTLKVGKFCMFGPDVTIHLCSNHHPDWITAYDFSWIMG